MHRIKFVVCKNQKYVYVSYITYSEQNNEQFGFSNMSKLTSPQKTHITQGRERVEEDGRRVVAESQHIDQVDLQDS